MAGVGCCHLRDGEVGHWPSNMGLAGGLGVALLGGWAEPVICSCSSPTTGGGGYLASTTTFTAHSCPAIPFDAYGHPIAGLGCTCGSLVTRACPRSHPTPHWAMLVGGLAKWL